MRRAVRFALAAAIAVAGLVPSAAQAEDPEPCGAGYDQIYVFSRVRVEAGEDTAVNSPTIVPEAACLALVPEDGIDPRWIYPGSNSVSVRYTTDLGPDQVLEGRVYGLGVDVAIELRRAELTGGGFTYDSQSVFIDPLASGELKVEIYVPSVDFEGNPTVETLTDTYRTMDH